MRTKNYILTFAFIITLFSCDKIKRKGHDAVDKTKHKIAEKKDAAIDKVIPIFNSDEPDTKFNKKRFEEFFGFAPPPDVSESYCFDDQIGIDSKFLFSFKCDSTTKDRIIKHSNLIEAVSPTILVVDFGKAFHGGTALKSQRSIRTGIKVNVDITNICGLTRSSTRFITSNLICDKPPVSIPIRA